MEKLELLEKTRAYTEDHTKGEKKTPTTNTHLSLQVDHVSLHFIVGFIKVINLFVELLDVLIIVQN